MHAGTMLGWFVSLLSVAGALGQDTCPGDLPIALLADDGEPGDQFGASIAFDGERVLVGARWDDDLGIDAGAAYMFRSSGLFWAGPEKITANDGSPFDGFGSSVAVASGTAMIGAPFDDDAGSNSGSIYVFEEVGGAWMQTARLQPDDAQADALFGVSVAIDGDTAIVGASADDARGDDAGSAYIFDRINGVWVQSAKITASDGMDSDSFGFSVAISGDTVIVGALGDDDRGAAAGAAYIFERAGGTWTQVTKLFANDAEIGDGFGTSVSIRGSTAIVGAFNDDDMGVDSGSAYIFERSGGAWLQVAKLNAADGREGDRFGRSVAIDTDAVVVGAPFADDLGMDSGSVYIFHQSAGLWEQTAQLSEPGGQASAFFGSSVAIRGQTSVIGSLLSDKGIVDAGAAYVVPYMHPNDCCADMDRSGTIDADDFFVFLDLFAADDRRADFNGDDVIDSVDFFSYLDLFALGCP